MVFLELGLPFIRRSLCEELVSHLGVSGLVFVLNRRRRVSGLTVQSLFRVVPERREGSGCSFRMLRESKHQKLLLAAERTDFFCSLEPMS